MKILIYFLGLLAAVMAVKTSYAAVAAGPVVNPANGHSYYLLTQNVWTASEAEAISLGGHLATINDTAENSWVLNNISTIGASTKSLWIGLNDVASEGTFVWTSGETAPYRNFRSGEPNNALGIEDYVLMYGVGIGGGADGFWNDYSDSNNAAGQPVNGVVEVVPEPSSTILIVAVIAILGVAIRRAR